MDWRRSWSDHEKGFRGGRIRCGNFEEEAEIQGKLREDDETKTDREKERLWETTNSNYGEKFSAEIQSWLAGKQLFIIFYFL